MTINIPKFNAACVLIINPNNSNEYLGVARKNNSAIFGLPGGKAEDEESLHDAAIREAKEETGLDIKNLKMIYSRIDENQNTCTTFLCEIIDGSTIAPGPGEAVVKWVTREVLESGPFGSYNIALFKEFEKVRK